MGREESPMTQIHFLLEHLQNVLTERMCWGEGMSSHAGSPDLTFEHIIIIFMDIQ